MDRRDFQYTECYCEENVYWLLKRLCKSWQGNLYAVFMSNVNRTVPIWCHPRHKGPVIWDYHVLAMGLSRTGDILVFDQDSSLPFPCPVDVWINKALLPQSAACQSKQLRRRWRCVQAAPFLAHFASDRSHMVKQVDIDGELRLQWSSPPPAYQCISTQADENTLPQYMDMSTSAVLSQTPSSLSVCHEKPFGVLLEERDFLKLLQP